LHAIDQTQASHHTRKQHNAKRTRADGIWFWKRNGQTSYLEYAVPFGVIYLPSIEGSLEQIQCRSGDSGFTIEGRNLWLLFEDVQARLCDRLQESDMVQEALPGMSYIETITVRLWL